MTSADLQPMLTALSQMSPISAASSFADADLLSLGDVNGDGVFNNADVQSLLDMLKTAGSSLTAVPEPATFVLDGAGLARARVRSYTSTPWLVAERPGAVLVSSIRLQVGWVINSSVCETLQELTLVTQAVSLKKSTL